MYPELTVPLLALLGVAPLATALVALRRPSLRRLALRQAGRRRGEALLVIAGSALGTAIIVGSLIVGDTLGFSVKRDADRQLGPIDEIVSAPTPALGEAAAKRVAALRGDPDIDGILTLRIDRAAVATGDGAARKAEPNASVAEADSGAATQPAVRGDAGSGLDAPTPGPGQVVLSSELAGALGAKAGDTLTFWLYGHPAALRVTHVVAATGVAGAGGNGGRNAFLAPGTLTALAPKDAEPKVVTFVSNTGDVESGNLRSDAVAAKLTRALGPLAAKGNDLAADAVTVDAVKQQALADAKSTGDQFGSFFLFIGATAPGLAARLAFASPLARRFRAGAILVMYGLVVFTIVLVAVLTSVEGSTKTHEVASATGGFAFRADLNPAAQAAASLDPATAFTTGQLAGKVAAAVPLYTAEGRTPPAAGQAGPSDRHGGNQVAVVGADPRIATAGLLPLDQRLAQFGNDRAAWRAALTDPRYVITITDLLRGKGETKPGDSFTLTDPRSGKAERKIIAGALGRVEAFFGPNTDALPVIMGIPAARAQFGSQLKLNAVLLKPAPGVPDQALAGELQGAFLPQGLVATRIRQEVDQELAANTSFDALMEGFLALGLVIGIGGLGVVMVRAVRERRRQVGVLRALGFQARVIRRAFRSQSAFIAAEGIILGAALAVVTDYLLFRNAPDFKAAHVPFSIPWLNLALLLALTAVASLLATAWPARQAARLRPAVALRLAD
jgi:ABC-type lipoprotein release transport system permease subunit